MCLHIIVDFTIGDRKKKILCSENGMRFPENESIHRTHRDGALLAELN